MAGRYATALFELALEERALDAVKADLDHFDGLIAESPDLRRLVRSSAFTAEVQSRALAAVLDMIKAFGKLVAQHKGEVSAEVTLAERPSDQHLDAIKSALNTITKKDVQVDVKVDPSIIGGLIVKLGSRMVDSSLRTKLNSIKHAMKEVS